MKVQFLEEAKNTDVAIVVGVFEDNEMSSAAQFLNDTTQGLIKTALETNRFKGKVGDSISIIAPNDLKVRRLLVVGFGKKDDFDARVLQDIGGHIYGSLSATPDTEAVIHLGDLASKSLGQGDVAAHIAAGAQLRSWRFDEHKTKEKAEDKPQLETLTVITEDVDGAQKAHEPLAAMVEGVYACRGVQSQAPNILYPETYAARIKEELKPLGVDVEILGEKEMRKLGMESLLCVGEGSVRESQMVVMQWNGGAKDQQPLAFVGKGVTFDTGGISLKPAAKMDEMKYDMSGSAAVFGLMKTLAMRKANVNVVGVVGLVENMPSGSATRPGDIVKSMSGQTIEVLNTDAEGRLVLADALWYTQDRFKPQFMVNLATLTGAIVISLGNIYAGLFSNNDELSKRLSDSGEKTGDRLWRFPMGPDYDKQINSPAADVQNIQNVRGAGSITAAQFLERFVNKTPWAHLDIAGTAWIADRQLATAQKGATGFGVRLLDDLVRTHYEA